MNKREAKDYTRKYIDGFMISNGFKEKKSAGTDLVYRRKVDDSFDGLGIGSVDYNPIQILRYSIYKRIDSVENIMTDIGNALGDRESFPDIKGLYTMASGYENIHKIKTGTYLPQMQTEADVKLSVDMIIDFLTKDGLPLLDKLNDIREIDKVINGDDFWITDWQMPFNLGGGNFYAKRLIIAKLAGGQEHLERVAKKNYEGLAEQIKLEGNSFEVNTTDLSLPIPFTVEYLKNVEPIY